MHEAQNQQHQADLVAYQLDGRAQGIESFRSPQHQSDVSDIDQIKAHDKKVVHGVGKLIVAVKGVHQKDSPVLM